MVCACVMCTWHGPPGTPLAVGNPRLSVSSRRNFIASSAPHESQPYCAAPPVPADVIHVPFSGLISPDALTGVKGIIENGDWGRGDWGLPAGVRMIGLKLTFDSLLANSCSRKKSSSAG